MILDGWVPEANYTIKVRATEGVRTIFDLSMEFELLYKEGLRVATLKKNATPFDESSEEAIMRPT